MYASVNKILSRENDDANERKESRIQEQARREFYETFLLERCPTFQFRRKNFPNDSQLLL